MRSGVKVGRFFGVMRIVMSIFRVANWCVRSRSGSMWPCAGYGKIRMWVLVPVPISISEIGIVGGALCVCGGNGNGNGNGNEIDGFVSLWFGFVLLLN